MLFSNQADSGSGVILSDQAGKSPRLQKQPGAENTVAVFPLADGPAQQAGLQLLKQGHNNHKDDDHEDEAHAHFKMPGGYKKSAPSGLPDGAHRSAIFIPVGTHLACQRDDAVVFSLLFHDAVEDPFHIGILDQQAHAAAEFALNGPGGRGDAVFVAVL